MARLYSYRGRLAPSPTGYLHLGHARTFWIAWQRARASQGILLLRNEDLDPDRSRPEFATAMLDDLRWLGLQWQEGPDCGGPCGPYVQSQRREFYRAAFEKLRERGCIYPCQCSRKEVLRALRAPHQGEEEPVYPGTCRPENVSRGKTEDATVDDAPQNRALRNPPPAERVNWRFRVPDGLKIGFEDLCQGPQSFEAGRDFGDFVVWRHDGVPSYQLAVVADDAAMGITEVVRGADLLLSTARQLLLYRALEQEPPAFYHCRLVTDAAGVRLAKRHESLSLRALRAQGVTAEEVVERLKAEG